MVGQVVMTVNCKITLHFTKSVTLNYIYSTHTAYSCLMYVFVN